jgi:hypothetical protein
MANTSLAQRRANATAKAESLSVDYFICPDQHTVIIASATTLGKLYTVTSTECSCPAGRQELPCKHAAYRLNILHPRKPATPQTAAEYDAMVEALNDCLF